MVNLPNGSRGVGQALWHHALRAARQGLSLGKRVIPRGKPAVKLGLLLLVLCACLRGQLAVAFQGSTSGEPLNIYLPTEDTDDWGDEINSNFTEIRSTVNALALSTGTNAAAITAEAAARLAQDLSIGVSTAGLQTQLGAVGLSTGAIAVSTTSEAATRLAQDQALQVELNAVGMSTGSIAASTTTLYNNRASSGTNADITSINALGVSKSSPVFTGTFGLGGAPSGTRKFQVYFNANNNSPSYGDGAVRYLDSVNGVGFECGALYGGSQPSWCQSGNDGMGSKKPFVFQPDGSNVGIRTLSPATTAALEVAGPVSVGGSGNTQYSLQASSGASFGSDLHVTGTLEATKLKGDGSQLTGIGGGGTVTTQGSPAAGQVAVFQAGTVLSSSPISVAYGAGGAATTTVSGSLAHPSGSAVSYANGAVTVYGDPTTGNMLNSSGVAVWAKSIDGITQSSGCLVAMQFANTNAKGAWFSASADTATLVFTSTTTTLTNVGVAIMPGVLLDTCAPLSICHVGIKGMFRVQTTGASSQYPDFTTTRCAAGADNAFDASAVGGYMNTAPAAGMTWIQLR
jgi:hypothetical protein